MSLATAEASRAVTILYRDESLVAVSKPSGLLVHRTELDRERDVALQRVRDALGQRVYPVHRLDRATSGVLVFALTPAVAGCLAASFRGRDVAKDYLAVVRGWAPEVGEVDRPVPREKGGEKRPALTRFRRLATVELPIPVDRYPAARYSLVRVVPLTGRRHQIRRHMERANHPLVGDTTYGHGPHNRLFRDHLDSHRLLLHAWRIAFPHPVDGTPCQITASPAADFADVCAALGWPLSGLLADTGPVGGGAQADSRGNAARG
ncbi:tRNA pseudouridine synthase C [wastewater metagenome]|uniref:tRNA pseudouridine synthase C n=2 Tax=unclassified sequences TaxID=12908 RepID=A0A5B8RGJ8_9ZZZZ|nr:tRNA pseudouridine synthase C [uncultured organism]